MGYYIVNEEGEVIKELQEDKKIVELGYGDRILRSNSINFFNNRKNNFKKVDFLFVKVNVRYIYEISCECPLVICLLNYIGIDDNILKFPNGRIVNPHNLSRVTSISLSTCKRQFRELIRLGIISRTLINKRYVYIFNPYIANRSKEVSIETLKLFKDSAYKEEL